MTAEKTIDVKGLSHEEKEKTIFPALEDITVGEAARIIFDFNPIPLVYMLKARNEFEFFFEKEGPQEWILNIKRTAPSMSATDRKEEFKDLLTDLKQKELTAEVKGKAKKIFQALDAKTLGILEQELIREGVSHEEIRKSLCDIHLEVIRDALVAKRIEVASPHPIFTFMEEHKLIIDSLNTLGQVVERTQKKGSFQEMGEDVELLKEISHHLVEAENHHQREEDVLFPKLQKHDITEPTEIMKMDHVEFRERKKALYNYAFNWRDFSFQDYKKNVIELGEYLTRELESHIFKEDNILYQIALQVLSDKEWDEVKRDCDKIGYCCFTPEDQKQAGEHAVVELDLRPMPPFERHEKIFEVWNKLGSGKALRIINDHNPKPLWYQFEVEYKDRYQWEYEQQGPKDWIVKITKI